MKMKNVLLVILVFVSAVLSGQSRIRSIIQEENEKYSHYAFEEDSLWDKLNGRNASQNRQVPQSICTLTKKVYGWHPYWGGTTYQNYDWSLISDFCYFSYEVNPSTGNDQSGTATPAHNFSTSAAVTAALNNNVNVTLCVTLFSNHSTLWGSSTAQQTLISNLISMVQARGAKGVNIDFEGMGTADKTPFKNFMQNLCTQMHSSIPGSEVSMALYAVEWSSIFDIVSLNQYVDYFIIMGYDYYYGGSTTAGPTDPLYNFSTSYNYTLSKSVTYYLRQGVTPSKLLLGLPYYGREWQTTAGTVPSSTVSGGFSGSRTYKYVRDNAATYSNKQWDVNSFTPYYVYQTSGQWRQCFIDDAYSLGKRFDLVNQRGIGGIGIWALGYDDGYSDLWNKISSKFTTCATIACSDTIYDMGGPNRNYYDNESYAYTISPAGASLVSMNFTAFSLGSGDTLRLYNGASITSPLIGTYTATNSPGTVTSTGNAITVRFKSDVSGVGSGFMAKWNCITDNVAPTTQISSAPGWASQNFNLSFTDADNSGGTGIEKSFYQVLHNNGTEWRANALNGFFNDNFDNAIHPDWTTVSGTWTVNGGYLVQSNQSLSNTNIYAPVTQNLSNRYLYHWQGKIEGTGTNRRAGFHFFCDNPSLSNRGNSYFVWFRLDDQQLQFYEVVNDTFTLMNTVACSLNANSLYDYKVFYDRITGKVEVYVNDVFVGSWTDPTPYSNGTHISLRSGNCSYTINDLKVYRSRTSTVQIKVGASNVNDIMYQNSSPSSPAGRVKSLTKDAAGNLSLIDSEDVNVDWTVPVMSFIKDGPSSDLDTTSIGTELRGSWRFNDPHSGISSYSYSIGTAAGDSNFVAWANAGMDSSFIKTGLSLTNGTTYFTNVRATNAASLRTTSSSDGILYYSVPSASFSSSSTSCEGVSVLYTNTSSNATSYSWTFQGGVPGTSSLASPTVMYNNAGSYQATLIAYNGTVSDTTINFITVNAVPNATFGASDTSVYLPNSTVQFNPGSLNETGYLWNFGDGVTSSLVSPSHTYLTTGSYSVSLTITNMYGCSSTYTMPGSVNVYPPVGVLTFENKGIQVYPIPASEAITITNIPAGVTYVSIRNLQGKLCLIKNINGNQFTFDVSELAAGLYSIELNGKEQFHGKIAVTR